MKCWLAHCIARRPSGESAEVDGPASDERNGPASGRPPEKEETRAGMARLEWFLDESAVRIPNPESRNAFERIPNPERKRFESRIQTAESLNSSSRTVSPTPPTPSSFSLLLSSLELSDTKVYEP